MFNFQVIREECDEPLSSEIAQIDALFAKIINNVRQIVSHVYFELVIESLDLGEIIFEDFIKLSLVNYISDNPVNFSFFETLSQENSH